MSTATMQAGTTARRRQGGARAAAGQRASSGPGRRPGANEGAAKPSAERRAVMVRHTIRILVDYDGLEGTFATVTTGDTGDGKVWVRVRGDDSLPEWHRNSRDREILLTRGEWELVPGEDPIRHCGTGERAEAASLISRGSNLIGWELGGIAPETPERHAAAERRRLRIKQRIAELQRRENEQRARRWERLGIQTPSGHGCRSLVVWEGGAR
jgi:hypothetical protein